MSVNFLRLIPTEPHYVPGLKAQVAARDLLRRALPEARTIEWRVTDTVEFVDPGGNLESIRCPHCGSSLDVEGWWPAAMDAAYESSHFEDLRCRTPCCGREANLNNLVYHFPVGFARFVLEAKSPNVPDLAPSTMADLETILGCRLRRIWAHY